jgi:hypothetical protein
VDDTVPFIIWFVRSDSRNFAEQQSLNAALYTKDQRVLVKGHIGYEGGRALWANADKQVALNQPTRVARVAGSGTTR